MLSLPTPSTPSELLMRDKESEVSKFSQKMKAKEGQILKLTPTTLQPHGRKNIPRMWSGSSYHSLKGARKSERPRSFILSTQYKEASAH